jgi:hypothetical protein
MLFDRLRRRRRAESGSATAARSRPGAFHAPVKLVRRVANWPPGTPVTIVESFGGGLMVEVADGLGATLDILVVRRELLTV